MNAAASAASSCAISSSIFAQIGHGARRRALDEILAARRARIARSRLRQICLVEVQDDQQRLRREELKAAQPPRVFAGELQLAQRPAVLRARSGTLTGSPAPSSAPASPAFFRSRLEPFEPSFDHPEVREDHFVFHRPHVARRIDGAGGVRHRRVAEHPHDVQQRVGVAEGRRRRAARPRRPSRRWRRPCRRIRPSRARASSG